MTNHTDIARLLDRARQLGVNMHVRINARRGNYTLIDHTPFGSIPICTGNIDKIAQHIRDCIIVEAVMQS